MGYFLRLCLLKLAEEWKQQIVLPRETLSNINKDGSKGVGNICSSSGILCSQNQTIQSSTHAIEFPLWMNFILKKLLRHILMSALVFDSLYAMRTPVSETISEIYLCGFFIRFSGLFWFVYLNNNRKKIKTLWTQ